MYVDEKKFKDFVVDGGLVSKDNYLKAEKESKKTGLSVAEILTKENLLDEDDVRRVQAKILSLPFVEIDVRDLDFETLKIIPEAISRKHSIVAIKKDSGETIVAVLDVKNIRDIHILNKKANILPHLTSSGS